MLSSIFAIIYEFLANLTAEQIALLSLAVSLLIYVIGKHSEIKLRKHEAKKEHYTKLVDLFSEIFIHAKDKKDNWVNDPALKRKMFDLGASLAIYGSRKIYKVYIFTRSLDDNPFVKKSKYYDKSIIIYLYALMFSEIRKEVGLNNNDISLNDILAFFINNFGYNPLSQKSNARMSYNIFMLRCELFYVDTINCVHFNRFFHRFIHPIFGFILLSIKYLFLIPVGRILVKKFPNLASKEANNVGAKESK